MSCPDRPLVLVAPRWELEAPTVACPEQLSPSQAMAHVFSDALVDAGATPLMMPITDDEDLIAHYVDLACGIALPGGQDVNPALWGDESPYDPALLCPERDAFEQLLLKHALASHKPLFTTCRGTQILNVVLGGTLCMDVPSLGAAPGHAQWRHTGVLLDPAHPVELEEGSVLRRALGDVPVVQANSSHHCCVDKLGRGLRLVARASDGVPEGVELEGERFCVGVQWHPEYTWRTVESDRKLWHAFVDAAREGCKGRLIHP